MSLNPTFIKARDIPDAWYQCLYALLETDEDGEYERASTFLVQRGSFAQEQERLEFDSIKIQITHPRMRPFIPDVSHVPGIPPPTDEDYINEYVEKLMTDQLAPNELYTYGERIVRPKFRLMEGDQENAKVVGVTDMGVEPLEYIIENYRQGKFGQCQMTMAVGIPNDIVLTDPPCLRTLDTKVRWDKKEQVYKLHFEIYFRSWDLWGGLPSNLAGFQILKEYMVQQIDRSDVVDGEIIANSKSLHVYGYAWDYAKAVTHKTTLDEVKELKKSD